MSDFDKSIFALRASLAGLSAADRRHYADLANKLDAMELRLRATLKKPPVDAR